MAQEYQYVCDGCGDVVHGKQRGQFFHRDYIQIKGQIVLQQMDNKTRKNLFTYLTYGNRIGSDPSRQMVGEELTFCVKGGMPCIEKFLERRRNEIAYNREQKRVENLREIRRQEILNDSDA